MRLLEYCIGQSVYFSGNFTLKPSGGDNQLENLLKRSFKANDLKKELLGAIDCCEAIVKISQMGSILEC